MDEVDGIACGYVPGAGFGRVVRREDGRRYWRSVGEEEGDVRAGEEFRGSRRLTAPRRREPASGVTSS